TPSSGRREASASVYFNATAAACRPAKRRGAASINRPGVRAHRKGGSVRDWLHCRALLGKAEYENYRPLLAASSMLRYPALLHSTLPHSHSTIFRKCDALNNKNKIFFL